MLADLGQCDADTGFVAGPALQPAVQQPLHVALGAQSLQGDGQGSLAVGCPPQDGLITETGNADRSMRSCISSIVRRNFCSWSPNIAFI